MKNMLNERKLNFVIGFAVVLSIVFIFTGTANAASSACSGKKSGESCSLGDGHSVDYGTCDASGSCISNSTTITTASGAGSNGQINNNKIPGTEGAPSQIIQCGRAGQRMCTLCDLIAGLNNIIRYLEKIAIGVALLAFTLAGVMYIVSAGDTGMTGKAKTTMKNAGIGFIIIFAGWIIINTAITSIGAYSNLGMNITSWGKFECTAR